MHIYSGRCFPYINRHRSESGLHQCLPLGNITCRKEKTLLSAASCRTNPIPVQNCYYDAPTVSRHAPGRIKCCYDEEAQGGREYMTARSRTSMAPISPNSKDLPRYGARGRAAKMGVTRAENRRPHQILLLLRPYPRRSAVRPSTTPPRVNPSTLRCCWKRWKVGSCAAIPKVSCVAIRVIFGNCRYRGYSFENANICRRVHRRGSVKANWRPWR